MSNWDKELDQNDVKQALNDKSCVVLDLRPKGQFQNKHIKGSVNVPLFEKFETFVAPFVADKKVLVVLNNEDLEEAKKRLDQIPNNGIQGCLKGGINNWDDTYHQLNTISCEEFSKTKNQKEVNLYDVRSPQEFQAGCLKGAQNVNIVDMPKLQQVPLNKNGVNYLYCKTGMRAHMASSYLEGLGYKTVNIEGGFEGLSKTDVEIEKSN